MCTECSFTGLLRRVLMTNEWTLQCRHIPYTKPFIAVRAGKSSCSNLRMGAAPKDGLTVPHARWSCKRYGTREMWCLPTGQTKTAFAP